MIIRWAEKSDLQSLVDIFNYEVLNGTASFSIRPRSLEERTVWFEQHDRGRFPLIVAGEDKRAVGYEYRGRKIGDALMEELLRIAKENGEVHAIISVITADNAASIRLHEKFGFQFCGITREVGRKFGRWLDAAFYQLNI